MDSASISMLAVPSSLHFAKEASVSARRIARDFDQILHRLGTAGSLIRIHRSSQPDEPPWVSFQAVYEGTDWRPRGL